MSTASTRFLYDGWLLLAEVDDSDDFTHTYTWGLDLSGSMQGAGGVGGLLAITVAGGGDPGLFATTYDGNGNVIALISTDGIAAANYDYGPFGEPLRATGPAADANRFRFSTKWEDQDTGWLYYGYRWMDPGTGRFLNRDPIEEAGGINVLAFCANNPINEIDALGLRISIRQSYDVNVPQPFGARGRVTSRLTFNVTCRFVLFLHVTGTYELNLQLVTASHNVWKMRLSRYDSKWGNPRSNSRERQATLAHEEDHYRTYERFILVINQLNSLDGKCARRCSSVAADLRANLRQIYGEAVNHSKGFDRAPLWNGGNYSSHPFVPSIPLVTGM